MKKFLVYQIIFILLFQLVMPIVVYSKTTSYLATGDSIAYGYGLPNIEEQRYSEIVRGKIGVSKNNCRNLAVSGMTCQEYYTAIQATEFTNAIKNADLMTVSIGSNELLELATGALASATGIPANDPAFLTKVKQVFEEASLMQKYAMATTIYNFFTSQETKDKIEQSIQTYQQYWDLSVKYIKEVNPNINIVATEFYNPYYEVQIATFDLGGYAAEPIEKMNTILHSRSNNETDYKIAKIYDAFNTTNPRLTNVDIKISMTNSSIELDPHPNVSGHEMIATKVMDAIATIQESKKNIGELNISDIADQTYTGKEIKPVVVIKDGTKTLVENTDYTLIYIDNTAVGEAKINIVGIGEYEGNVIKTFNIKEQAKNTKDINSLNIKDIEAEVFTGVAIKPDVSINDGNYTLENEKDYILTYQNNVNVGNATIIIRGVGNYEGETTKTFSINPKSISGVIISDIENQKYTGNEINPDVVVYDGSIKLVEKQDYNVSYNNNTNVGTATVTITGINNYTGSANKSFEIIQEIVETKKDISEVECTEIEDKIYTGKLITPEVTLKDGEKLLTKDVDYKLTYENNLNIGEGKLIIAGLGDYKGSVEKVFNIIRKDINHTYIEDIPDQTYTGKEIKPDISITNDYIKIVEGTDYTVEYKNNINEGTAQIIITGINNFEGTMIKTFNIVKEKPVVEPSKPETNTVTNEPTNNNYRINTIEKDPTVSNRIIPQTGQTLIGLLIVAMLTTISILLRNWLNRNKNI
ncbi:MAG: hypothetical protein IKG56_04830 [Clostridia bacterium]|nr:hypothetical protein [Clostridia bacterium]